MQRSKSQVLYRYLPGSIYRHEDELVVRTSFVDGNSKDWSINKSVLLNEIDNQMEQWPEERIADLPRPSQVQQNEFVLINPQHLIWDIWPLVFSCTRKDCGRVRSWYSKEQLLESLEDDRLKCDECGGTMRQLDYFSAHNCGQTESMYAPECNNCGSSDDVYLKDTGSFRTSSWHCRECDRYIQGTRQSPCNCDYSSESGQTMMRMFTVRDNRPFNPHFVTMLNMDTTIYRDLQDHPNRNQIAIASFIGDQDDLSIALEDTSVEDENRYTPEEWAEREAELQDLVDEGVLPEKELEDIRSRRAPDQASNVVEETLSDPALQLADNREFLERAVLFDSTQMDHYDLENAKEDAIDQGRNTTANAIDEAKNLAENLGISHLSVTLNFPIVAGAYGFTRVTGTPGEATLRSFAVNPEPYDGRTPIFTVNTDTEALLVSLSALKILNWLSSIDVYEGITPTSEREARLEILEIFAQHNQPPEGQNNQSALHIRRLLHSLSHCMQHALVDGKTGVGEASLSEWLVPSALTFGIYVSSFQSYTLGALWSLLQNRSRKWLQRTYESIWSCENDPFCHQREPRACERCLYVTFGCSLFNDELSRRLLTSFWRHSIDNPESTSDDEQISATL